MPEEQKEEKKIRSLRDAMAEDEVAQDDAALVAELLDENGKLKVDDSLPEEYKLEVMAKLLLDHLAAYHQTYQAWRAARNRDDNARAKQLFDGWNFNRLTAAIIEHQFPKAKALADEVARGLARQIQDNRKAQASKEAE